MNCPQKMGMLRCSLMKMMTSKNNLPTFTEMRRANKKDRSYQESKPIKGLAVAIAFGCFVGIVIACLIGILIS